MEEYIRHKQVRGWAEILYRLDPSDNPRHSQIGMPKIAKLSEDEFRVAGSWLPTVEFVHTFDLMEMFQGDISDLWNVPRPIRAYDAINLCTIDPMAITTLLVWPRSLKHIFEEFNPQYQHGNPLMLLSRPTPFKSFRHPGWPKGFKKPTPPPEEYDGGYDII